MRLKHFIHHSTILKKIHNPKQQQSKVHSLFVSIIINIIILYNILTFFACLFFFLDWNRQPWQKQYVNHFKFITLLEYKHKFSAMRNYWIIKNKSSQKKPLMLTEYNKSHIQGILNENGKNTTLHNFVLQFQILWVSSGFQMLKTTKPLSLRPCGFKCFLAFGDLIKPLLSFLK